MELMDGLMCMFFGDLVGEAGLKAEFVCVLDQ